MLVFIQIWQSDLIISIVLQDFSMCALKAVKKAAHQDSLKKLKTTKNVHTKRYPSFCSVQHCSFPWSRKTGKYSSIGNTIL